MNSMSQFISKLLNSKSFLRVMSVLIAIFVWFYINTTVNPKNTKNFDVAVTVGYAGSVPDKLNLAPLLNNNGNLTTNVVLSGSNSDFLKFKSEDITVHLDFSSVISPGVYDIYTFIDASKLPANVSIESINPKFYSIEFEERVTREMNITAQTTGKLPAGYLITARKFTPSKVTVIGPKSIVDSISRICVPLNIDQRTETLTDIQQLVLLNANGEKIDTRYLVINETEASAELTIAYQKQVKLIVETFNRFGKDENPYTKISYSTSYVTMEGNEQLLSAISEINLGKIDLADITLMPYIESFNLPTYMGLQYVSDISSVDVTINMPQTEIKNIKFSKSNIEKFTFINQMSNTTPKITTESFLVSIRSLDYMLDKIDVNSLKCEVDLLNINENGQYPIVFTLPEGVSAGFMDQIFIDVEFIG